MNLTNLVYKISLGFLNPTIRGMKGYLQTKGTNVKWERIRDGNLIKLDENLIQKEWFYVQ